jgi:hypothetical protein
VTQAQISVSGDEELLADVKAAADEDAESVSAWLIDAAAAKLRNRALRLAVEHALAEHGATADDALAAYESARRAARLSGTPAAPAAPAA